MEAVKEKAAEHERNLAAHTIGYACGHVLFVVIQPWWPQNLVNLAAPRLGDETSQGDIPAVEFRRSVSDLVVVVRADLALARPDRSHLECWLPRLRVGRPGHATESEKEPSKERTHAVQDSTGGRSQAPGSTGILTLQSPLSKPK